MHLVWKLLHNDRQALRLVERNPFPEKPPTHIRIQLYKYDFAPPGENRTWNRELRGTWLPPVSKKHNGLRRYVERRWDAG
jgi:hypothetical protein